MSITRFRYFEKVARLGSIREAAETLHVAPSALSRQIAQLEQEYGVELFERYARGMTLTSAGEILFSHARGLLDHHERARSEIADLQGLRRGDVCVGTVEGMVKDFVVPTIAEFQERHPGVRVELNVASTDLIINQLMVDEVDIGILFDPLSLRGLSVVASMEDPLHVVVSPRHPAAAMDRFEIAEICKWRIALPDSNFGMRHILDRAMGETGIDLNPALVTNSIEALRSYARSGKGMAILTPLSAKQDLELGTLKAIPILLPDRHVSALKLCTRQNRTVSVATQELSRFLCDRFINIRKDK